MKETIFNKEYAFFQERAKIGWTKEKLKRHYKMSEEEYEFLISTINNKSLSTDNISDKHFETNISDKIQEEDKNEIKSGQKTSEPKIPVSLESNDDNLLAKENIPDIPSLEKDKNAQKSKFVYLKEFQKLIESKEYSFFVYVIECLKPGFYYIGYTSNPVRRISSHAKGYGSEFTKRYGFKRVIELKGFPTEASAKHKEKMITEHYVNIYGRANVSGASYIDSSRVWGHF